MDYVREAKRTFSRFGIAYAAFLLAGTLIQMEVAVILQGLASLSGRTLEMGGMTMFFMSLPLYLIGAPVCWLIVKDLPTPCRPMPGKLTFRQMMVIFVICISIMYIGNLIGLILMTIVNGIQGKPPMNPLNDVIDSLNPWMIFVLMVVMAPLFEEFLYRKLLIDRTAQYGDKVSILMSGFLFGLSHGNFYQFFYAFGLGIVFAYIYLNTGKLRYTIGLHAIINFMGSLLALQVAKSQILTYIYGVLMLALVVLGIVFLILFRRKIVLLGAWQEIPRGRRFRTLFLNFGMLLFFFVSLGMFLMTGQ